MAKQGKHTVDFYVVFEAQIWNSHTPFVQKIRPKRMVQKKPDLSGGEVAVRFAVDIPDNAFLRLMPDVVVDLPDGFWTSQPVEVIVPDPTDDES